MSKSITWEKYENYVNNDLKISKLLMAGQFIKSHNEPQEEEKEEKYLQNTFDNNEEEEGERGAYIMQFPITPSMIHGMQMCSRYECWVGHCNFDLTKELIDELNLQVEGVEYLKIYSRYRFMVGLGKAFDFKQVRINLETKLGVIDEDTEV